MVWNFGDVLGCVVLLVLIKSLIVAMVMKSFGFSWEASTLAGACMAQVGTVCLFCRRKHGDERRAEALRTTRVLTHMGSRARGILSV